MVGMSRLETGDQFLARNLELMIDSRRLPFRSGRAAFLFFTAFMTDDHAPSTVRAEMNKCLELGGVEGRANVWAWVLVNA